jgi:hypothetical protein
MLVRLEMLFDPLDQLWGPRDPVQWNLGARKQFMEGPLLRQDLPQKRFHQIMFRVCNNERAQEREIEAPPLRVIKGALKMPDQLSLVAGREIRDKIGRGDVGRDLSASNASFAKISRSPLSASPRAARIRRRPTQQGVVAIGPVSTMATDISQ